MDETLILQQALERIHQAQKIPALDVIKSEYLGKQGVIGQALKALSSLSIEEKKAKGQSLNSVKQAIEQAYFEKQQILKEAAQLAAYQKQAVDVTLPGRGVEQGRLHPITLTQKRMVQIFREAGFSIWEGPERETDFYNFTALNIPEGHPARAMQDTFYFGDGHLLRTHTSGVQIRALETQKPPLRIVAPGRVFRRDEMDMTHTPMFHQLEGLMIDEHITLADLKGVLHQFLQAFFERPIETRFRSSYFPFTEPSLEVDISCVHCNKKGCRFCKGTGFVELFGCGMVHPNVLQSVGIDPDKYQGFAFGMGIDRFCLLRYGIDDLRWCFQNDLSFLQQF